MQSRNQAERQFPDPGITQRVRFVSLAVAVILLLSGSGGASPQTSVRAAASRPAAAGLTWQAKIDPWVLEASQQGPAEFLVFLTQQADLRAAQTLKTQAEKGEFVFRHLTETAARTQRPIIKELIALGVEFRSYWIANLIWVRGDETAIRTLAARADVARLYANPAVPMKEAQTARATPLQLDLLAELQARNGIAWNILKINAPQVWAAGYTGQGVVVGGQDTGYQWDHPALKNQYRGWDGASADHSYAWHDAIHTDNPQTAPGNPCGFDAREPCDDGSHGTHTMGILVGDGGDGRQIGVAPGARWIGCRNMEQGTGTPESYLECYQWFLAPTDLNGENPRPDLAPQVVNNSWSCPPSEGCDDPNVLLVVVNNIRAAGILTVHSAGNSGPACGTVQDPAAIYAASFTVGNTDANDRIHPLSSRGPAAADGSRRLKPDVSAPGTDITSSVPGGYTALSGTSMASPHAAGAAALLLSARPEMAGQVDAIEETLRLSAVHLSAPDEDCGGIPGASIPNNTYGWGRIDALAAIQDQFVFLPLIWQTETQ